MIRIICPKCKNAYLKKEEGNLICPSCEAIFPESQENLFSGIQYYNEGDFSQANDHLMKHIVKTGADPEAIFYKALCDAYSYDEDTFSLKGLYAKLVEVLPEISDDLFPVYLALANDETAKLEKLIAENHIKQFETADAEKIKKQVSTIISLQNEAKEFRNNLTEFVAGYNERATNKISVKLASCCLVEPEIASNVGSLKFDRVKESIESHTVFTGILSTDIKNLEIYYRCIVMFFEKNRQKYDFLMESAEKFTELSALLEEGRYSSIKGVSSIASKLKSAAYDFFQESLKDHDDEFEQQTETVVVIVPETVEIPVEETPSEPEEATENATDVDEEEKQIEYEDIYSSSEEENATKAEEVNLPEEEKEVTGNEPEALPETEEAVTEIVADEEVSTPEEEQQDEIFELPTEETVIEITDEEIIIETEAEEESVNETVEEITSIEIATENEQEVAAESEETEKVENNEVETISVEVEDENEESTETEEEAPAEETSVEETVIEASEENEISSAPSVTTLEEIAESGEVEEPKKISYEKVEPTPKPVGVVKHKKSYGPFVAIFLIVFAIAGLTALKVVPEKLNQANYEKATQLFNEKNYAQAAVVFAELEDYSDAEEKELECRYKNACALEAEKKFDEAKTIFEELGNYEDSAAKKDSCAYNAALAKLDKGNYDEAAKSFEALGEYADSKNMIKECSYKKAISLINKNDFEGAIELLSGLGKYSDTKTKILEAKYGYVTSNLDAKNETTTSYLKELVRAEYKDSADLRNKLLGTTEDVSAGGVTSCINYNAKNTTKNIKEADNTKVIYFHVVVDKEELYNKKLTIDYTTSMGYHETKDIVLTKNNNTFAFAYPSTPSKNYTVTFKLLSPEKETLTQQEVVIK